MADEPLQQAEAALAAVAEQFERWRQTRATGQDRIPPSLWDQAVAFSPPISFSLLGRCDRRAVRVVAFRAAAGARADRA